MPLESDTLLTCWKCNNHQLSYDASAGLSCPTCGLLLPASAELTSTFQEHQLQSARYLANVDVSRLLGGGVSLSDEERKDVYLRTMYLGLAAFAILYASLSAFFPMQDFRWYALVGLFVASRFADLASTKVGLWMGGVETNPLSDPYDIGRLMLLQVLQVTALVVVSLLVGLANRWFGNGILFVFSLVGFEACFANLAQVFAGPTVVYHTPTVSDVSRKMYAAHVTAIIIVAAIASGVVWIVN